MKDPAIIPLPSLKPGQAVARAPQLIWIEGADGSEQFCRLWPGSSGMPVIVYLHGIEGHGQWFENSASHLNRKGMTIFAPDRRGAGANQTERGHMASYKLLLHDIELVLNQAASAYPGSPIILMGNCWGAKAALAMARHDYQFRDCSFPGSGEQIRQRLKAVVLTSPAIFTSVDFHWKVKLGILIDVIKGGAFALKEIAIPIETSMFTDNAEYLRFIEEDPLRLKSASKRFYFESFWLTRMAVSSAPHLRLPLLLLQSGGDQIVNVPRIKNWFQSVNSSQKELRIFPDTSHSLDFDPACFDEYIDVMSRWLLELKA